MADGTDQYFGEKSRQVDANCLTAFGIDIVSRYGKARELAELLVFAEGIARQGLSNQVVEAFYDSNSCCCRFRFAADFDGSGSDAMAILEVARKTVSQFDWDGHVEHGGPMRDLDF